MSNLQRGFIVSLKQIRRRAKSEASAVFAEITENDLQFLDEEVDLSTSFHFPEDNLISGSSNNDKENQQNNLLNISNQQDNNSNCNELSNAENNDDMETDRIIKEDVIRVRHDLFNRSSSSETSSSSTSEASDAEVQADTMSQKLRLWNVQYNITLDACRALLKILKPSHPELPLDPRTLNRTPKKTLVQNLRNVHMSMLV
ncbi:putative uncharacterized protein DDB_G0289963 [Solenopsis invicta]|uniref:putative uncharacterized protein DDB_G0289963 n=1 Tax=Solenopsis invicta TaxID=13686 RepID=UPI00193DFE96|nr:putative uncharacterized protein DDB_G0289963 [Solenopsis invicta]